MVMNVSTSTRLLMSGPTQTLNRLQGELLDRQRELSSGRNADTGLKNGYQVSVSVQLQSRIDQSEARQALNSQVAQRYEIAQSALTTLSDVAHEMVASALGARTSEGGADLIRKQSFNALNDLSNMLNTKSGAIYVFGGHRTDKPPMANFDATSSAATAINTAFTTRFGFAPDDAAASTITDTAMLDFLNTDFATLFEPAGWSASWSSAEGDAPSYLVKAGETVSSGITSNDAAFRNLAMGYAMLSSFANDTLSPDTLTALVDRATALVNGGIGQIANVESQMGVAQERVVRANENLARNVIIDSAAWASRESVDPYDTSVRLNTILTSIETSYALTSRLQGLSLLNFLR